MRLYIYNKCIYRVYNTFLRSKQMQVGVEKCLLDEAKQ